MKISPRDKKFIIAGTVALCLFVLIKFIMFPAFDWVSQQREDLAFKEKTVDKYSRIISKQGELQKKLKLLKKDEIKLNNSLVKGETASLSAADIQKSIDRVATSSTIEIQSVKIMDSDKRGEFVTVPIQVRFTSDLARMKNFIYSIETSQKLLTIPKLKISVRNRRDPKEIIVTMTVTGYMKKEAKG
jgi:type II secretory pathway component PulM